MQAQAVSVGALNYELSIDTSKQMAAEREAAKSMQRLGQNAEALQMKFNVIASAVKVYALALSTLKMAEVADDFRMLQARVNVASDSIEAGAKAFESLRSISASTRSALDANVQVFTRLNPSIKQMGGNAQDTLRIVELLSKAITVSGASAQEKTSAMIQFGQALGSGKLAGDELRSLLENAPYLMKQLAAGLGVPIGQLKSLGEQGKLTADVVVTALSKAATQIDRDFSKFPVTVASGLTLLSDSARRLANALDELSGKNAILVGILGGATTALNSLADVLFRAGKAADDTAKKTEIQDWSRITATALSYVADAADIALQTLQSLGKDVAFVLGGVGREIAGIGAQAAAVLRGDFAGAGAISDALRADGEEARRVLDAENARILSGRKTWGQQMRQAWAEGMKQEDTAPGAPSKLKAPVDPEEQRKNAAKRAAAQAYLEGLLADTRTGLAKIDAEERKALDENKKRSLEDTKNADIYGKARAAIAEKYARERAVLEEGYAKETAAFRIAITEDETTRITMMRDEAIRSAVADEQLGVKTAQQAAQSIYLAHYDAEMKLRDLRDRNAVATFDRNMAEARDIQTRIKLTEEETIRVLQLAKARGKITDEELRAGLARASRDANDAQRSLTQDRSSFTLGTLDMKAGLGGADDQAAAVKARADLARQAALQAKEQGIADEQAYNDRIVAINKEAEEKLQAIRLQTAQGYASLSNAFGSLTEAVRSETGKQDAVFKAAFIAQKAFAIASAIVNIQAGIAQAANAPFPMNLAGMATVVASTASIISTIKGANYGGGREYGGPVSAGTMYRVNEAGRPEMFTAANGAQYMLPTTSGNVTSANKVAEGPAASAQRPMVNNFNFHLSGPADQRTQQQIAAAAARGLQMASARNN